MSSSRIPAPSTDVALLLLRLAVGVTFLLHGVDKLGDLSGTEGFFDSLGIPLPGLMAPLVALLEVGGGLALVVGLLVPLAGVALALNMLVAGLTAHTGSGFFVMDGGFELVLVLGAAALSLAVAGAGRFSADAALGLGERIPGYPAVGGRAATQGAT